MSFTGRIVPVVGAVHLVSANYQQSVSAPNIVDFAHGGRGAAVDMFNSRPEIVAQYAFAAFRA